MKAKSQKPKVKSEAGVFLLLDPGANEGRTAFSLVNEEGQALARYAFTARRKSIERLLAEVVKNLKKIKKDIRDVKGIIIARGGDSFSAVRGVHAVANSLGWMLSVPVIAGEVKEEKDIDFFVRNLLQKKRFHPVAPLYSRGPNITHPSVKS